MPDVSLETLNLIANVVNIGGVAVVVILLYKIRRLNQRVESVLAPKVGIEGYLSMCGQVIEADPDGTCVVSDEGEIVLVNKSLEDISGYHRSQLIGRTVEMLVPDSMRNGHQSHRAMFVSRPSSRPMRGVLLRHKQGVELPVDVRLNRYSDPTGGYTVAKVRVPQ